ncbi:MAG: minor capsid protein, partial [Ruminiclostridium sp.]|nr:minor capsid protein [Ruminiclostridium sp.]
QAELKGMKDAGFDEYEFISLGEEAENVCDTCDDLDGERFKISEAAVGVNCPPMHPFCRCKVTTPQETLEDIQADIERMLEGTSIEEIEQRLDQMIAEREALPESDSTLNSAQESAEKTVDNFEKSVEVDYAKSIGAFNFYDIDDSSPITAQGVIDELNKTNIGRETLKIIDGLPENIKFTYGYYGKEIRGDHSGGQIRIFINNCPNTLWVARTVIHECTHYRYGIGQSQWAEVVCIAQELKHARGRDYLTIADKRLIIKAVKSDSDYEKLNWRKGGIINGRRKSH